MIRPKLLLFTMMTGLCLQPSLAFAPEKDPSVLLEPAANAERDGHLVADLWTRAGPSILKKMQATLVEIRATIDELIQKSEPAKGEWEKTGVRMEEYLAGLDGGTKGNFLLESSEETPSLGFFDAKGAITLDSDWAPVFVGSKSVTPKQATDGGFFAISSRHVVFVGDTPERVFGNASCTPKGFGDWTDYAIVYRDYRSEGKIDVSNKDFLGTELETIALFNVVGAVAMPDICVIYNKAGPGRFRSKTYTGEGRPLPDFDDEDLTSITKSKDIREQLTAKMPVSILDKARSGKQAQEKSSEE